MGGHHLCKAHLKVFPKRLHTARKKDTTLTASERKDKLIELRRNSNREAARLYRERVRRARTLAY